MGSHACDGTYACCNWARVAICTTAIATATLRFPPSLPPVARRSPLPSNFAAAIHATACHNPAAVTGRLSPVTVRTRGCRARYPLSSRHDRPTPAALITRPD
ncbi:hypothetical protein GSI_00024 [Ganoderma sinense ZZ0214-1]|uniref:Uncharacterized protein n=1 Tax=Ganoderma sinense ZZ0214-1 TaxID=1077348 RepID=A0A2G8SRE2_9APHY|nr:hypothetical protein GSI_00024 [Ganoderma sinense ZZ0214-1]